MARTKRDIVNYFPHDSNASAGDTLTVLQSRFGNDGYAFWFKLLEKLSKSEGHFINCNNSNKWQLLLAKSNVEEITGVEIMKLLVEMQAIDKELWKSKVIWCQNLVDNLADVYKNRRRPIPPKPKLASSGKITTLDNLITTDNNGISTGKNPQSKVNKSKVNNKILYGEFQNVLLTDEEYQKLKERFPDETENLIERLSTYLESSGKRYKSHYATILNWQRRDKEGGKGKGRGLPSPKDYTRNPDYADL